MNDAQKNSFLKLQDIVFSLSANSISKQLPLKTLKLAAPLSMNDEMIKDLCFLRDKGLLKYDASLKIFPMEIESPHPVRLVVYYGGKPVGYAFGNMDFTNGTIEITWIEKRKDASSDLDCQFLAIAVSAYLAYAATLRSSLGVTFKQIALIGAVEGARSYYERCGFRSVSYYQGRGEAMVISLENLPNGFKSNVNIFS
ncbi:TPA: hypothetical protein ACS8CD_003107 [Providencia alcalifaciens]